MKILFGVPARLVASLVVAGTVASLGIIGTLAYFSGTSVQNATLTTATISIGNPVNYPLNFTNMLPGETTTLNSSIQNTGNRAIDVYVQLQDNGHNIDLCTPDTGTVLTVSGWWSGDVCQLYPGWVGSIIVPVAYNVPAGGWVTRDVSVTLPGSLGNAYQGGTVNNLVHLIAVQQGGPAPVPQTGAPGNPWPAGDSNYP